ncbi:MAG TPA: hypothetical protein VLI93_02705 [Acetobacteraceae bacterium]|nr:hypothetical protein [Acetobacteraceae bacterium]
MTGQTLLATAERLADILAAENAALAAMDLPRAAALLPAKRESAEALLAVRCIAVDATALRARIDACGQRLSSLAEENRRLLDRALSVQARVIGVIARRERARQARAYGTHGGLVAPTRPPAIAISARA